MIYKNTSRTTMTFYGIVFQPGDVKEVPGYINHPKFVCSDDLDIIGNKSTKTRVVKNSNITKSNKEVEINGTDTNQ